MKFDEIANMYYEDHKGVMKPTSFASSKWIYDRHVKDYWSGVDVMDITSRAAQKFYNYIAQKPKFNKPDEVLTEHVVKDIVGLFKTICYYAMQQGAMQEFTFKLRKPYGIKESERKQADFMAEADYQRLLELCTDCNFKKSGNAKIFALLSLTCGLRIGEVCGLKWEDVNFAAGKIKVRRTVSRIYNHETGTSYINVGDPKSKTSKREVVLLDIAAETLESYKAYKSPIDEQQFILGGKTPTEPRNLRQAFTRFLRNNEIEYLRPHGLRHTFCTNALSNGCDIKTVSALLGHSDTKITLDIYTHITERQMSDTVGKLNKLYSK